MVKRSAVFLILFSVLNLPLFGGHQLYVQSTTKVGPGITHKSILAPTAPWIINVIEVDLKNPYVFLESVKAKDLLNGMERTSSMAQRKDASGHRVIGAVNADFYDMSTGIPIGTQMLKGEFLKTSSGWEAIGFNEDNKPFIQNVVYSGSVTTKSAEYTIHGINKGRDENQLILYNHYYASSTNTNIWGTEALIHPVGTWYANDTLVCVIDTIISGQGNSSLPKGYAVLSGHGTSEAILNQLQVHDTIKVFLGLLSPLSQITDVVGGNLKILSNGAYTGSTNTDLHPRTIAGFSADSSILYLATIDGRQSGSIGMNYRQLADLMLFLGAYNAINLDGGGSTTMVIRNKIVNSLFADERSVANGLMVISTAPDSGAFSSIQISPDNYRVFWGSSIRFKVTGCDEYFNPVEIDPQNLVFICDANIGTIDQEGLFRAKDEVDSGYVHVWMDQLHDSAYVYIKSAKRIELAPNNVVTDNMQKVYYSTTIYDIDNLTINLSNTRFEWQVLNPAVGSIDSSGIFTGISNGETQIVATYRGLSDTAGVTVEIGNGRTVIDSLNNICQWSLTGDSIVFANTFLSTVEFGVDNRKTLCLNYEFVRQIDARAWVYLNTNLPVFGLPDSVFIDIKADPGDHKTHMMNMIIADNNDELFQKSKLFPDTTFTSYGLAISDFAQISPGSQFYFPIGLKSIQIRLGYEGDVGDTNRGVIYFDNLQVSYPEFTEIENQADYTVPDQFKLYQNYPNPFNASTKFRFQLPEQEFTTLTIYNIRGEKVDTIVSEFLPAGLHDFEYSDARLPTGIYLYRVEAGHRYETRKFILLK